MIFITVFFTAFVVVGVVVFFLAKYVCTPASLKQAWEKEHAKREANGQGRWHLGKRV